MHLTYKTFPDVDFSSLKLDGVRPGKNGMKFANLVGGTGRRLVCETPPMIIPWDTEIRKNEETGQCSSKIALSFQGMPDDPADDGKLRRFFNFLNRVDKRVKELAVDKKGELWQKIMDAGKVDAVFQGSVKPSTNEKYPPTFQGKIPLEQGIDPASEDANEAMDMKITVFRKDKTKVSPSELKKGCLASVIAEASYVWCTPMMIGISWVVKFVLVEPKAQEAVFQFTDIEDFADTTEGAVAAAAADATTTTTTESPGKKRKRSGSSPFSTSSDENDNKDEDEDEDGDGDEDEGEKEKEKEEEEQEFA